MTLDQSKDIAAWVFIICGGLVIGFWCYGATLAIKDRWEAGRVTAGFYVVIALVPYSIMFAIVIALLARTGIIR